MMPPVDQTFVLNLSRRPDRWTRTQARLARQGVVADRFVAHDGQDYEFLRHHWVNEVTRARFRTPGALACLLTHVDILRCAKLNGYRRIAVFEDDVVLHKQFAEQLRQLEPPDDWEVLYLGATQLDWSQVRPGPPGFYRPAKTLGTWAMLIDERAYERMLQAYQQFRTTADLTLAALFADDPTVYVASPNLCICETTDSDIRRLEMGDLAQRCRWDVAKYDLAIR